MKPGPATGAPVVATGGHSCAHLPAVQVDLPRALVGRVPVEREPVAVGHVLVVRRGLDRRRKPDLAPAGRHQPPHLLNALAVRVAGLLVEGELVQRPPVVGDLLRAVLAGDRAGERLVEARAEHRLAGHGERRPRLRALGSSRRSCHPWYPDRRCRACGPDAADEHLLAAGVGGDLHRDRPRRLALVAAGVELDDEPLDPHAEAATTSTAAVHIMMPLACLIRHLPRVRMRSDTGGRGGKVQGRVSAVTPCP